ALRQFCLCADENLPKLRNKKYSDYLLVEYKWEQLGLIKEVLEDPRFAQASFSSETEPTVWKAIPILELLQDHWETILNVGKFTPVHDAIERGLEKLRKWYMRI
ncbi:hypothetical protein BYT27DRAFT_7011862, partial [Phlegmacium glaucopus]